MNEPEEQIEVGNLSLQESDVVSAISKIHKHKCEADAYSAQAEHAESMLEEMKAEALAQLEQDPKYVEWKSIKERCQTLANRAQSQYNWLYEQYKSAFVNFLETNGKTSLNTPYGHLRSRKVQPKLEVSDLDALINYLKQNGMESAIKVTESIDKSELNKMVEETGEIPEGTSLVEASRSVWIEF